MTKTEGITVTGFEGPEKRLEITFKANPAQPLGLRSYNKQQWQEMLDFAACTIISVTTNDHFDAYVLSESSLFVYPNKMMIKTCGTTTLLKIIPKLLEYSSACDLKLEYVTYSRKNFLFPDLQIFPHTDWSMELNYLGEYFTGESFVMGSQMKDHWYLFVADYSNDTPLSSKDLTLEIMMHHLDRSAALNFYRKEGTEDRDKFPGVVDLIEDSVTDEFNFTPCGYSMNGLHSQYYSTIHVTPEPQCSYASYETNVSLPCYKKLIESVFEIFQPGTVTLTMFSERKAGAEHGNIDMEIPGYILKHKTVSVLGEGRDVVFCSLESVDFTPRK